MARKYTGNDFWELSDKIHLVEFEWMVPQREKKEGDGESDGGRLS